MELHGGFKYWGGQTTFALRVANKSSVPLSGFLIDFNKNPFRLKYSSKQVPIQIVNPGQTVEVEIMLTPDGEFALSPTTMIQIAIKNNVSVFYLAADCPLSLFFAPDSAISKQQYLQAWTELEATEQVSTIAEVSSNLAHVINTLQAHNVFLIAQKNIAQDAILYLSVKVAIPSVITEIAIAELTLHAGQAKCCIRASQNMKAFITLLQQTIAILCR